MFQQQEESRPWYQTLPGLIIASVLVPPAGIVLLWMRRGSPMFAKALGTVALIILAGGYLYLFTAWRRASQNEAHYAEVEQHRAQQAAQPLAANQQPANAASPTSSAAASGSPTVDQAAAAHATRNYWTSYRGPNRDGRYDEMPISTSWPSQGLSPLWKQPVGVGFASFVIADRRAYTIEQRRGKETVAAYDIDTGRELWTQSWNAEYRESNGDGPRATPTWDAGRIYALGATGELRSLDAATGAVVWGKNILSDNGASNLQWAMAGSPLIVDDKVIVLPGGTANKSVVAYNKMTGAPVWRSQSDRQAYSSPALVTLAGRRQIIVVSSSRVFGLEPADGSLIWSHPWDTDMGINVSQPIVVDNTHFFISSGYGKGAALVEVTGSGKTLSARTVWENVNMKNKFNSSVLHNGHVYGLDEGILTCVDVRTGERKWKGGRYQYGQVVLASGHLIILSGEGDLVLVRATPDQFAEVARFKALDGQSWNYPAIASGRLFVRNSNQMAAFNISGQ
jgi:outer membrane protein assembly factor BamB